MDTQCMAITAPQLIAPLSGATVTSQQPLFRWKLAPGNDGAQVEVCADRGCTKVVTTFTAHGTSGAPPTALSAGVYYWRARGTGGGGVGLQNSALWEFWVGPRSSPRNDTSWGATLDVNGDGFADVISGAAGANSYAGAAYVYLGSAAGLATSPSTTLYGPDGSDGRFGNVASAGDVNGDGFGDVIVSSLLSTNTGRAYLYLGSASGLATSPATVLTGPDGANGYFGSGVAGAGDVNGDGFADVLIGAFGANAYTGRAYLYLGSAAGLATSASIGLTGPDGAEGYFGYAVAGAGDVNGDGFGDVVVGAHLVDNDTGRAYVYLGGPAGLKRSTVLRGPDGANGFFGYAVAGVGDLNGDGFADVLVAAPVVDKNDGRVYAYLGSASGLATSPATVIPGPDGTGASFGIGMASAGDVNGDGFGDVVVGAYWANSKTGSAHVYLGGINGLATVPSTTLTGPYGPNGFFGAAVACAGDVNGDGLADIIVGASLGPAGGAGRAYLYLGGPSGTATSPATSLIGPDGPGGWFGGAVASAVEATPSSSSPTALPPRG